MTNQTTVDEFLDLACLTYAPNESPRRIRQATSRFDRHPEIATANIHAAATAGSTPVVSAFWAKNPKLVHKIGGPREWPPLMYVCYSRIPDELHSGDSLAVVKVLLEHGADPDAHFMWNDTYRFTALTSAIGEGEQGLKNQPPHQHAKEIALLLLDAGANSNVGVYGLVAYSVSQRMPEIGIRMALGAQTNDILREVLWQGVKLAGIGVSIGLAIALGLSRVFASVLHDVSARDPLIFVAVPVVLLVVATLTSYVPAVKAGQADPATALRAD